MSPGTRAMRRRRAAALVLVVGALLGLVRLVEPCYDGTPDASMYIITARSILQGDGYTYLGEPFIVRPPGFPLLLTPVLALAGTDFLALNAYMGLFGVACVALLFFFLEPRLGVSVALAVAAAVWLSPAYQQFSQRVLSDVPSAALVLVCLLLDRASRARPPHTGREVILGLCIAAATYVRSANLLLVPAIVLSRVLQRWAGSTATAPSSTEAAPGPSADAEPTTWTFARVRLAPLVVVPLVALLPWVMRTAAGPTAPAQQERNYSYATTMWHVDPGDPGSARVTARQFLERIPVRLDEVLSNLGDRMREREHTPLQRGLGALGVLALLVVLVRRRDAAEAYALLVFLLLSVLPAFHATLSLPIYLFAFPALVELLLLALGAFTGARRARIATILAIASIAALDFDPRRSFDPEHERDAVARTHGGLEADSAYLAKTFAPGAPLAATRGWHLSVYLERPVYSLTFIHARRGLAGVVSFLREQRIEGVVVEDRPGSRSDELALFLARTVGVERKLSSGTLFRIRDPDRLPDPTGLERPRIR